MKEAESYPITDAELDRWIPTSEKVLSDIAGRGIDIEVLLKNLSHEERYRSLPAEHVLVFAIRRGMCHYFNFLDIAKKPLGLDVELEEAKQRGSVATAEMREKITFVSALAVHACASVILRHCEEELRRLGEVPARVNLDDYELRVGNNLIDDVKTLMRHYVTALEARVDGEAVVTDPAQMLSVTKKFFKRIADCAEAIGKKNPKFMLAFSEVAFRHKDYVFRAFQLPGKTDTAVVSFTPVLPSEVIGDADVTLLQVRQVDRLALYDPVQQANPICAFGGLIESVLFDGPPGTGKTHRMKMMMTQLKRRAEQVGVRWVVNSMTADQIKDQFYGNTADLLKDLLDKIRDPQVLALLFVDDIDMLIAGSRDKAQGADNDIAKGMMDFFAGSGAKYVGNYISLAATNKPTGTDNALRQRFIYRALINGPQTPEEFADLAALELRKFERTGLLQVGTGKYTPLSRDVRGSSTMPPSQARPDLASKTTWDDIGHYCHELRSKHDEFTARSVRNAIQVAIARASDFDIPEEWFERPDVFRAKPWDERLGMLKSMYKPLTAFDVVYALTDQYDSESRYRREEFMQGVEQICERQHMMNLAADQLPEYEKKKVAQLAA